MAAGSLARFYGLDFGAVLALADAMGAANNLFLDLLPEIEAIVIRSFQSAQG